ncbi:MAG: hypothetical protein WC451_03675 [Patescibacteria group bacterium]
MGNLIKNRYFSKIAILIVAFGALGTLLFQAQHAHASWLTPVYEVLKPNASGGFTGIGKVVADIWGYLMAACNTLVLVMLIAVAFMNILRVQLDSYAVKKILPSFIMAVVLANFSFLICRVIIDFGNIGVSLFLAGSEAGKTTTIESATNFIPDAFETLLKEGPPSPGSAANYYGLTGSYIVKQLLILVGSGFVFALAFIFLIRNYFLYMLVAISPAAFMAMFLPVTKKYFQQWWGQFTKWVFMPITAVFWIWFAGQLIKAITEISGEGGWLLTSVAVIFCFYMAITSALKFDKAVGTWVGWGKKAWGKTGGAAWNATGGAGVKAGKEWVGNQYMNVKRDIKNKALEKNWGWSGSISKAGRVGRLKQKVRESYYADKDKIRDQEAFLSYISSDEFKRPDKDGNTGFKKPLMSKLKGQARELFVDDEWNREVYNGYKNKKLIESVPKVIDPSTGVLRNATLEDIADKKLTLLERDGVTVHGNNGDRVKAGKESGAATKELLQRRKGARNSADDVLSADPNASRTPNEIIEQEGLNVDPRIMASSAVPGQPGTGTPTPGQPPLQPPPPPNHGPGGRESLGDVRRRQQRETAGREAEGAADEERSDASGGEHDDMIRVEELLEQILIATEKSGQSAEQMAAGVSRTASGPNAGVGIAALPEIRGRMILESLSPQAKAELGILQDRANQRAAIVRQRLETRQAEQQLRALRKIGENEEAIIMATEQGKKELETGVAPEEESE